MRTFKLINNDGTEFDLTVTESLAFLHSVSGLGYEKSDTYKNVGDTYVQTKTSFKQPLIKGTVALSDQQKYEELVRFCQITPLKLKYEPIERSVFYCRGVVSKIEYDEKKQNAVDLTFSPWTPFYKTVSVTTYPDEAEVTGKVYDYTYPFVYNSATVNSVILNLDSALESPCKLTLYGRLTNPEWRHYVNGRLFATGKIIADIEQGNRLVIDTTNGDLSMKVYNPNNEEVRDMYQASDFSTKRAIYLQRGQNQIAVSDDNSNKTIVIAEGEFRYASV